MLYPMNALANDQVQRLRDLLRFFPEITFGRYIGDTRSKRNVAVNEFRNRFGIEPQVNELLSREEIQARPPHILITNFAMLEYLLFIGNSLFLMKSIPIKVHKVVKYLCSYAE